MKSSDAEPQQDAAQQDATPQAEAAPRKRFTSLLTAVSSKQPAEPQPDLIVQVHARRQDQQLRKRPSTHPLPAAHSLVMASVCVLRPAPTASSWHSGG